MKRSLCKVSRSAEEMFEEVLVGLHQRHMESFGLSHEDAQDWDHWRLKINGGLAHLGLPGKCLLKRCVYVCVSLVG